MVFSSIPSYLDPSNWQQQHQNHQIIGSSSANPLLPPPQQGPPPPPAPPQPHGGGGAGSIRPGSMAERARLANMPMPETQLKCPRCDSTNTKFCYFNNYSLSQPRHFCKSCRRYWTRGGALRNVPVGGGCRRNKRSKSSSSSKSPASGDRQNNPASTSGPSTNGGTASMLGLTPPLRFMSPLSQLTDNFTSDMGLNYSGMTTPIVGTNEMNFPSSLLGGGGGGGGLGSFLSGGVGGIEQWRLQQVQQFPFLGGLDPSPPPPPPPQGIFQFHGGESGFMGGAGDSSHHQVRPNKISTSMLTQLASIKMEENPDARQLLGGLTSNDQNWNSTSTPNWTDLSSFSSSSTSNPL